ncbi:MAG: alpha/beta hydrolase [Bacillati bacterium ANGP1]|uniref:Alpha/beta hydrolase n=1 Tax=Candidatus Segetimicrobium genomatis TaxID=2569760 RepID=A0A537J4G1_9BACT|nr:MAG: alpha/beta hydrolase [Terrabacteria group bacterium ANGP1]
MQSASEPPQGLPVAIPAGSVVLEGALEVSDGRRGVVLFAHGSGSSRHSPRNRFVARSLREAGLATLLIDLLTVEEERSDAATGRLRFDIRLLAGRLAGITDWLGAHPETRGLPIGYFGASTGAAAALVAAAQRPAMVAAIVSRGGRPDLARPHLSAVRAPALFIVGERDLAVLDVTRAAMRELPGVTQLAMIAGASHLFEEPGALEEVARLAREWLARHLAPPASGGS